MGGRGSGGRNATPTALKQLKGNPGKRDLNHLEPKPLSGRPRMPAGLSKIAQEEWNDIIPLLEQMGVLTVVDGKALAAYCSCYALWMLAEREIVRPNARSSFSKHNTNPFRVRSDALRQMKSFLIEFGLTPASRTRLKVNEPGDVDPFEKHLAQTQSASSRKPN